MPTGWLELREAVELYRGDFLDGFYDDWILNERYRLETLFSEALARLMASHEAREEHDAALAAALRLLDHDPLREDAHRAAMRAYCRLGQRNAALAQYRRCREIMVEELGAEPMAETNELFRDIVEERFEIGRLPVVIPIAEPERLPVPSGRSPLDMIAPSKLVGRAQEMALLHDCWRGAQAGHGGLVLISGEAGVGKTRLVEEFANRLRWRGTRVLWGRCYEFERTLPYQPVAEAMRTVLPTLTGGELVDLPDWTLGQVARLVPEVLERYPETESPLDQERARLFEGVAHFLTRLSSQEALLLVLEDLHWASESTLELLHYLARYLADHPVLLVGTFRSEEIGLQHPLLTLRRRLTREGLARPLRLPHLSPAAVETMVVEMSGVGDAAVPLARRLYAETEGNPFFLMEITKALFETGAIRLEQGAWRGDFAQISKGEIPLPAGVSEAIQARVHRLKDDAQEAVRVAAVLGREFDFDLLNAVWGRGEEDTLQAVDALLRHRLIDEGTGAVGRDYSFTHHKIQEALYAGISRQRRQRAHGLVGKTMEALYGAETEAMASELAFHFEQGQQLDKTLTEKATKYLLSAGDQARLAYAHEEAIDHYQRARALLLEQGEHERAARTLMTLGLTYHSSFDFRRARQAYKRGFALWQQAGQRQEAEAHPAPQALRVALLGELATLDPTIARDDVSTSVIKQLFSGLVELTPELDIVPDVARSWEVLDGGRKYVFHLRDDARWSDGAPLTAGDFEYSWKRVLDPATGSPNADLLYDVKGARAFHQGEAGKGDVGVRSLNDVTLVVELERPTGYLLHLMAHTSTYPLPRHVVETHGEAWTEMGNIVTNGPFKLAARQRGKPMVLVRSPAYHGQFTGNVRRVEISLIEGGGSARLALYEGDRLDILGLRDFAPLEHDRVRQRHAGEYVSPPALFTAYVGFDVSRPPFDDVRVRRAFVLATDRETLADVVMRGRVSPARGGFVPPGMPGHSAGTGLPYNPDRARQLLAEAGYLREGGRGFPPVDWLTPSAPSVREIDEYLSAQWRENLGIDITWEALDWTRHVDRLQKKPPHLFDAAWSAGYPDPNSFLGVSSFQRYTRWQNEAYDRLVEKAGRVMDQRDRMKLYRQADRILVEDAAIMPLFYWRAHLLVKPWVIKLPTPVVGDPLPLWKDVIIEPH